MGKEFKSLSDEENRTYDSGTGEYWILEKKVKEFIKIILKDYDKRIDKIQQSFEPTDDPIIATERFNLMKILCGFVDEVNERAGDKLTKS